MKNCIAVVVATILNMIVGYIWYSRFLFGAWWSAVTQVNLSIELKIVPFIYGTILAFFIACLLTYLIRRWRLGVSHAAQMSFFGWLTFMVPYGLQLCIYAGISPVLFAIDMGYNLVVYTAMSVVIAYIK